MGRDQFIVVVRGISCVNAVRTVDQSVCLLSVDHTCDIKRQTDSRL
jgi:hypothetical protein